MPMLQQLHFMYIMKNFTNYVEKVKVIECEEGSEVISNSEFRTDNESINESEMSTF